MTTPYFDFTLNPSIQSRRSLSFSWQSKIKMTMIKVVCLIDMLKPARKKSQNNRNKIIILGLSKARKWKDDNSSQSESYRFCKSHTN